VYGIARAVRVVSYADNFSLLLSHLYTRHIAKHFWRLSHTILLMPCYTL